MQSAEVEIEVLSHALDRWRQRVCASSGASEVAAAARLARVVPPSEPLPYGKTRRRGTEYRVGGGVLFVLDPESPRRRRLVTVVSDRPPVRVHRPTPSVAHPVGETPLGKKAVARLRRELLLLERQSLRRELRLLLLPRKVPLDPSALAHADGCAERLLVIEQKLAQTPTPAGGRDDE